MSDSSQTTYRSYLLRLWREEPHDTPWRAMLESIMDPSQRRYFKDLESLAAYLQTWILEDEFAAYGGE